MSEPRVRVSGVGIVGLIALVLIVLKAFGFISWTWALSPIWIPFAIATVVLIIAAFMG